MRISFWVLSFYLSSRSLSFSRDYGSSGRCSLLYIPWMLLRHPSSEMHAAVEGTHFTRTCAANLALSMQAASILWGMQGSPGCLSKHQLWANSHALPMGNSVIMTHRQAVGTEAR